MDEHIKIYNNELKNKRLEAIKANPEKFLSLLEKVEGISWQYQAYIACYLRNDTKARIFDRSIEFVKEMNSALGR